MNENFKISPHCTRKSSLHYVTMGYMDYHHQVFLTLLQFYIYIHTYTYTFMYMKVKVKSLSHAWLFATPWIVACPKLLCPWDFQGKSTGVGCHFLLQGISQPRYRTQVSHTVDRRFTIWATREVLWCGKGGVNPDLWLRWSLCEKVSGRKVKVDINKLSIGGSI